MNKVEIGKKYGMLTVVEDLHKSNKLKYKLYKCKCDCSNTCVKSTADLLYLKNPNCGCVGCSHFKHRMKNTPEYRIWKSMKQRCLNKNNPRYSDYGGRGIKICQRWIDDFMNFYNDMGPRPDKNYSIDRIDNDGDYCPENCRWETNQVQCQNTRHNKFTADDIRYIREDYQKFVDGMDKFTKKFKKDKLEELAEKFNSSIHTIRGIISRKTWKNIQ